VGLSGDVWLQLVLLVAAVPVAIFGGAWILQSLFSGRRRRNQEIAEGRPAINKLTVAVEILEGDSFSAHYIADDLADRRGMPADPPSAATLADLRDVVDAAIVVWYGTKRAPQEMVVDYSVYPWDEGAMPKDLAEQLGTDWLVFEVQESSGGFSATNKATGLSTTAETLDALSPAVQVAIAARWPSIARDVPGMLTWQRTLTAGGFVRHR
jgi:hypothetical protein